MNNKICDLHAHLVPGIDDGAKDFAMAINMIRAAHKQGTRHIVCASHSYGNKKRYYHNLAKLQREVEKIGININLYPGCEIYCYKRNIENVIAELKDGTIPTINKSKYVLIEFDPYEEAADILYCIAKLHNNGYNTILAHTERYFNLFGNNELIPFLQEMGCLFQVNAYSIQDTPDMYSRMFARKLLEEKRVTFIGSDAHRTDHRPYLIENGINYLYQNFDVEYVEDICYKNARNILHINKC